MSAEFFATRAEKKSAFARGLRDAELNRAPIFRAVGSRIEPTVDDNGADDWGFDQRFEYLRGYDS